LPPSPRSTRAPFLRRLPLAALLPFSLGACSGGERAPYALPCPDSIQPAVTGTGLVYRADARLARGSPDTLWVEASVTNWREERAELWWGAQALRVQAWVTPDRAGSPVWDSQDRRDPVTGRPLEYPSYGRTESLAPGVTVVHREWRHILPVPQFLGDSLQGRRYYFTVTLRISGDSVVSQAPCVQLSASDTP
jgi:hypothetical protein